LEREFAAFFRIGVSEYSRILNYGHIFAAPPEIINEINILEADANPTLFEVEKPRFSLPTIGVYPQAEPLKG
jgi:hypothetical protein